ncbi:MAG: nitrilase-related carbon-nitrogen hydrolase, partial [Eubacteriales bacterium]
MSTFGFIKAAAASPRLKVADLEYNVKEIEGLIRESDSLGTAVIVFPELCLTGYTCADLFGQRLLLDKSLDCLAGLLDKTTDCDVLAVVGIPLPVEQKLYNCAVAIQHGKVLGVVPKTYPANYKEFYENRWFTSGYPLSKSITEIRILGRTIPFGSLIFHCEELGCSLGIEICEDMWAVVPPSSYMALNGAN